MTAYLKEVAAADVEELARWLAASTWPFHREVRLTEDWVRERAATGMFDGPGTRSFWYVRDGVAPLGIVRAFELEDITPLLDLRIGAEHRGQGIGTGMLRAITTLIFNEHPELTRLAGYTRHDNVAMCRVFTKCGYQLEARHRRAWPVDGSAAMDALGYAILREDWERG